MVGMFEAGKRNKKRKEPKPPNEENLEI